MGKTKILAVLAKLFNEKRKIDNKSLCDLLLDFSLSIKPGSRVLDIGCGSGRILLPLAALFPSVKFTGFDISSEMLGKLKEDLAQNRRANVEVLEGDFNKKGWNSDLANKKFDTIIVFQAVHFAKDLNKFIADIASILSENGRIIIVSTNHKQFYSLPYCKIFDGVLKRELERTPDELEIISLMQKNGLGVKSRIETTIKRLFKNSKSLEDWLNMIPFSALTGIPRNEYQDSVDAFVKEFKKGNLIIDKFVSLTFSR